MLVIRLFRVGKKNQPAFKIVVADKRNPPKSGRFVEEVGFWNPLIKQKVLNKERIKYWLSVGAQPSETIHNLLVSEKIIEGEKVSKHKKSKKKEEAAEAKSEEAKPGAEAGEKKPEEEVKAEEKKEEKPAEEKKEEKKEEPVKEEKVEQPAQGKQPEEKPEEEKKEAEEQG